MPTVSLNKILTNFIVKQALEIDIGGAPSRYTASTLGRLNPSNLPQLIMTGKAYDSPHTKGKDKKHRRTAEDLERGSGNALSDTILRLGGGDVIDDVLWKKERGEKLPWYKQLGGRVLQNPRTSLLGKAIGLPSTALQSAILPLFRMTSYNPYSDAAVNYTDDPVLTQHELGHAIDFNTLTDAKGDTSKSWIGRQGEGALRDLYTAVYSLPFVKLWHEAQANVESRKALVKAWEEDPDKSVSELREVLKRRAEVLPAGYGSYIGDSITPVWGGLPGLVAGKVYGLATSEDEDVEHKLTDKLKDREGKKDKKKSKKR